MVKSNVKKHFCTNVHIKLYMLLTLGQWNQIVTRTGQGLESQRRDYKQIKLAASAKLNQQQRTVEEANWCESEHLLH